MAYVSSINQISIVMEDDERRTRTRKIELDAAFVATEALAQNFHDMTRAAVPRYYNTLKRSFDGAIDYGTLGDVNDKTNLLFKDGAQELRVFPLYDLDQSIFVDTTGPNAQIVKSHAVLTAATAGTPEKALSDVIDLILAGDILIGGDVMTSYVSGKKVD